jgi:hypothetical protein
MAAFLADVDGDGDLDLVTKQKFGQLTDADQIEITLSSQQGTDWTRIDPTPIDTTGFQTDPYEGILRPQNLAVADLYGNTLPEIIAGFGAAESSPWRGGRVFSTLDFAIWDNSCVGDVNLDGRTANDDVLAVTAALGTCVGEPGFNPDADVDKTGCVDGTDLGLVNGDIDCRYYCAGQLLGDSNCNGVVNGLDIDAFAVAVVGGESAWTAIYGGAGCDFLCVNDMNYDGFIDGLDIDAFLSLIGGG